MKQPAAVRTPAPVGAAEKQQVLRTAAATVSAKKPPGVMNSAFDTVKTRRPAARLELDPLAVAIQRGVTIPPVSRIAGESVYAKLWARMAMGDCVELPDRQAHGLAAHAKKIKSGHAIRRLREGIKGVWRTAI